MSEEDVTIKNMEGTTSRTLTDLDVLEVDRLIEQSGIKIWQPKTWRENINKWYLLFGSLAIILVIVSICLSVALKTTTRERDEARKELAVETERRQSLQDDLNATGLQLKECQADLQTAWDAWSRRNDLFVEVLNNLLGGNTGAIELDNNLATLDILNAEDCDPLLSQLQ